MNRKKVMIIYGFCYLVLSLGLIVGLKIKQKSFNQNVLEEMINGGSNFLPRIGSLCQTQLLGEPKVGKDYVKINFYCLDGTKSMSTLALKAFGDRSIFGVLDEYGRIVNFDKEISKLKTWTCKVNGNEIDDINGVNLIEEASTVDCFQKQ